MKQGSREEDDGLTNKFNGGGGWRSLNHFYDPLDAKYNKGLSDVPWDRRDWGGAIGRNSFDWGSISNRAGVDYSGVWWLPFLGANKDTHNIWSWQNARGYEWLGLTATDQLGRQTNLDKMFRSVGQDMHLLEDASQPQHVRNEQHLDKFGKAFWESSIEDWGKDNVTNLNYGDGSKLDWRGAGFTKLEDFWDRHRYAPGNTNVLDNAEASGGIQLGLAEWCNGNFLGERHTYAESFSPSSIKYYPYPSLKYTTQPQIKPYDISRTVIDTISLENHTNGQRVYIAKTGAGVLVPHHSALTYFGVRHSPKVGGPSMGIGLTINDPNVLSNYHSIFIPKAVKYSAGLLDYYFRGTMSVTVSNVSWEKYHLIIENTSGQDFQGGRFRLFYDNAWTNRTELVAGLHYSNSYTGTLTNNGIITADFDVPGNATNYLLVFRGTIGIDASGNALDPVDANIAIAASKFTVTEPTCPVGAVIDRWQNVTKVRPAGDSGGTHYTDTPSPRFDAGYAVDEGLPCSPAGTCGAWLAGGDLNGISEQVVGLLTNDIMTYAGNDAAHQQIDHNCYLKSGTVDMTAPKLFGAQWVLAQKNWHGCFGFLSYDGCATPNPNQPPDRTKYLTRAASVHRSYTMTEPGGAVDFSGATTSFQVSVARLTGISKLDSYSLVQDTPPGGSTATSMHSEQNDEQPCATSDISDIATAKAIVAAFYGVAASTIGSSGSFTSSNNFPPYGPVYCTFTHAYSFSVTRTDTSYIATIDSTETCSVTPPPQPLLEYHARIEISLSNPYTAADCYADFLAALATWDMSDTTLAKFRKDEKIALAPLCLYDEVGPTSPVGKPPTTMDDYTQPQNGDGSWPQRAWLDPNSYLWISTAGVDQPMNTAGGNTLKIGIHDGSIIAHTQAGSDRHFWFGAKTLKRVPCTDDPSGYVWVPYENGDYSDAVLPPVTLRWLEKSLAQYDGQLCNPSVTPAPGNLPQAWLREKAGVLLGGKYVQAIEKWPAWNCGRPCGQDKFAVDQTTACCITAAGVDSFTFTRPSMTGSLPSSGYIAVTGSIGVPGIYPVTGVSGSGPWTVSVGTKIDDLPTGGLTFGDARDAVNWLGWLRWPSASGICGRAAITTDYASGTITITPATMQPWLRLDPATGTILVDVYDADMALLVSGLALTRDSDSSFTATHTAIPTAAYLTGHGVDWTKYDAAPRKTGVHLEWSFDQRKADSGFTSTVPTWYAGVAGCLACNVTQFNYSNGVCPVAVGIVPFYGSPGAPVENWQGLFAFPDSFNFDDAFGAVWMASVQLTMPDPFYQAPFKPDCDGSTFAWLEDDGSGKTDNASASPPEKYHKHHPLVEATSTVPPGSILPTGVTLYYDSSAHTFPPPYYPLGIPIGDATGNYGSYEQDWGFTLRARANLPNGRFGKIYEEFVPCE